ncbi:hypothetical protein EON65_57975, partial [archaeon]
MANASKPQFAVRRKLRQTQMDEDISSDDEVEDHDSYSDEGSNGESNSDYETPDEKRRRLAKSYLETIKGEQENREEDEGISERLRVERLKSEGSLYRSVSSQFSGMEVDAVSSSSMGMRDSVPTCLAAGAEAGGQMQVITGSKDNSVTLWDIETGKGSVLQPRWSHNSSGASTVDGEVLAVAVSSDGQLAASGGRDRLVR